MEDDDEFDPCCLDIRDRIEVGDMIEWTHPMHVVGNNFHEPLRARVVGIDLDAPYILTVDNGELIPNDTKVRVIERNHMHYAGHSVSIEAFANIRSDNFSEDENPGLVDNCNDHPGFAREQGQNDRSVFIRQQNDISGAILDHLKYRVEHGRFNFNNDDEYPLNVADTHHRAEEPVNAPYIGVANMKTAAASTRSDLKDDSEDSVECVGVQRGKVDGDDDSDAIVCVGVNECQVVGDDDSDKSVVFVRVSMGAPFDSSAKIVNADNIATNRSDILSQGSGCTTVPQSSGRGSGSDDEKYHMTTYAGTKRPAEAATDGQGALSVLSSQGFASIPEVVVHDKMKRRASNGGLVYDAATGTTLVSHVRRLDPSIPLQGATIFLSSVEGLPTSVNFRGRKSKRNEVAQSGEWKLHGARNSPTSIIGQQATNDAEKALVTELMSRATSRPFSGIDLSSKVKVKKGESRSALAWGDSDEIYQAQECCDTGCSMQFKVRRFPGKLALYTFKEHSSASASSKAALDVESNNRRATNSNHAPLKREPDPKVLSGSHILHGINSNESLRGLSEKAMRAMLRGNGQHVSGNKSVLLQRIIDGVTHGRLAKCPTCKVGRLKIRDEDPTVVGCSGPYDRDQQRNVPCAYRTSASDAARTTIPWKQS